MNVVTPREMSYFDQKTIEGGIPSQELMEKAGIECFKVIKNKIQLSDKVLIICGSGNNGGDGQVIARLLKEDGYDVQVLFTASLDKLKEKMSLESTHNYIELEKLNIPLNYAADTEIFCELIPKADVIIDAVFGTGLDDRELSNYYKKLFEEINKSNAEIISIDIPSGLSGKNGKLSKAIQADLTIIIQSPKTGELLENGPDYTGDIEIVDIGIDTSGLLEDNTINQKKLINKEHLKFPFPRKKNSHKYHYGRVIIVAGSRGMLGAAALASGGALRCGAGLVTNYVPEEVYSASIAIIPPEALVEPYNQILTSYRLEGVNRDVILFGPGLGRHNDYSGLLSDLLNLDTPIVIDADGLWMMRNSLDLFKDAKAPLIITPHHGEFATLLGITTEELKEDPIHYAAKFAQNYNVIVILKGHHSLVASPNGEIWFNITGNAGMATPGSGDVLAGMTAAILAQLKDPLEAAKSAVYYHGLAGDYYAENFGQTTLLASDIIESLKYVLK